MEIYADYQKWVFWFSGYYLLILVLITKQNSYGFQSHSNRSEAYFNGTSYLRLQAVISSKTQTELSFRTCTGGNLFSQQHNGDLIEMSVVSSGITFLTRINNGTEYEEKVPGHYMDNKWHTVRLEYFPDNSFVNSIGNLTVNIDGITKLIANSSYRNEIIRKFDTYTEGAAVFIIGKNFNGCLLEGPLLIFDKESIISTHNVRFEQCPLPPDDDCTVHNHQLENCPTAPCLNGGICIEDHNRRYCNCTDRWTGANCEKPFNICDLRPCLNNGTCIQGVSSVDYTCNCVMGFEGDRCEVNINDCIGVTCPESKHCVDLINRYECRCVDDNDHMCNDEDQGECSPSCLNGSACKRDRNTGNFSCYCLPGWTGPQCNIDIDECNLPGVPICNQGICLNNDGGFQCYCRPGYTGEMCNVDFDECLSMPCRNNATCLNKVNNFECVCPPGYQGKDCSIDINECESMPCANGSTCLDGINKFTCICEPGLTGLRCDVNIDDCEPQPCLHNSTCIDGLNSYTCNCTDTGYSGVHCEVNIDDCVGNSCVNGAECIDDVKDYHCTCFTGYTGKNCEIDINECDSNPCQYSGTCLERSNLTLYNPEIVSSKLNLPEIFSRPFDYLEASGYECICVDGVTGPNCEIDIDECQSNPCFQGSSCKDQIGSYYCECAEGYEGEHCDIDIDECEKYEPCVNGHCIDKKADYFCECNANFGGKNCSVALIGCNTNPCLNGGSCKPYLIQENVHKFNCSCPNGYQGHVCDEISTMSLIGSSEIVVNTTRDEGYDIQFRFKTTLPDGLLALGRGPTFYILELANGRLNLRSSLLNKWEGVFIGSNLTDSKWQRVFVAINATHLVLSANDEQTIYPITFNENYNASYTSFLTTYIGGVPSNLGKLVHGPSYVGCIEDVFVNGEWVSPERKKSNIQFKTVDVGCLREPQCNPNPCHSNGQCTDLWRDFRCVCERPYLGHTCQYNYTAATFGYENITNSLVTTSVTDAARRAIRTIVDISMFIRTRQPRGQIFYLGSALSSTIHNLDETYIVAQLEGGELLVRIQFNGTPEAYTVSSVKLDNGYNHLIEVIRNVTLVQVKLNGTEYFRKTISATGQLDAQVLFLGGQPQLRSVRQTTNDNNAQKLEASFPLGIGFNNSMHFKGIIQDVQISNGTTTMVVEFFPLQIVELETPMQFGTVSFDKNTVLEGVHSDDSCRLNPCHNGHCENTWNDYICVCQRGYKGKDCNDLQFCELEKCPTGSQCKNLEDGYECLANGTFDGKTSPLQYNLMVQPAASNRVQFNSLEINYRTRSWGTIFLAKYKQDYFAIFAYHNRIVAEWRLNHLFVTKKFQQDVYDGQWSVLYFIYKDSVLRGGFKDAVIDDSPQIKAHDFDFDVFTQLIIHGTIFVAGSDSTNTTTYDYRNILERFDHDNGINTDKDFTTSSPADSSDVELYANKADKYKTTDFFKGCLGEIRLGGLLLPFFTTKELYPKNRYSEVYFDLNVQPKIGCILCYSSDCFNDGFCINPNETYNCNCTEGYTAPDCSIDINECESHQCRNNATCKDLIAKYECDCLPGFDGIFCETDIDECRSNPCKHGGTCIDLIGTFKCECHEDYVGKQCEAPLLITCDNKPCKDGSTCQTGPNEITGNNFTCICTEGMEGHLCDTPYCFISPCLNGHCNTSENVPFCDCHRGYEGALCETDIDDCISPIGGNPCQNQGTCIDGINRFDCNCTETGFNGLLCELDINECESVELPCGPAGMCQNIPGSYECICEESSKCGHFCKWDDLCSLMNPCSEYGDCTPKCLDTSDYICNCNENYTGKNCTDLKFVGNDSNSGFNIFYVIIPVVFIIVLIVIIVLVVLVNIAKSKRATRGTYSPSAQEFCNPRVELDHVLKPPPEERLI